MDQDVADHGEEIRLEAPSRKGWGNEDRISEVLIHIGTISRIFDHIQDDFPSIVTYPELNPSPNKTQALSDGF